MPKDVLKMREAAGKKVHANEEKIAPINKKEMKAFLSAVGGSGRNSFPPLFRGVMISPAASSTSLCSA